MAATKEVGAAIIGIQQGTQRSIAVMGEAASNVGEAQHLAAESGASLDRIVTEADAVAGQIRAIAAAAEAQSSTSGHIAGALEQINGMAGESASAMTQSARAVTELAKQAHALQTLVAKLREE